MADVRPRTPESVDDIRRRVGGERWSRPTEYRGIKFRSYLESRFAWHLDSIGEEWLYEPRRFSGYLPDFEIVSAAHPTFMEVKPTRAEVDDAQRRMTVIWETLPDALLVVVCAEGSAFFSCQREGQWLEWQDRWRSE